VIKKTVTFKFNVPCGKNHVVSTKAIELIKKSTKQRNFKFNSREVEVLKVNLTLKAKNKNNLNNMILKIVKQLKESEELKKHDVVFTKTEDD
jgi:hypothetical protein